MSKRSYKLSVVIALVMIEMMIKMIKIIEKRGLFLSYGMDESV